MSPRQSVDRERIWRFFEELGKRFRGAARIFLVGGTTTVFEGLRESTIDIDLTIEVAPEDHGALIAAIRDLRDELSVNVEEVSPGDFIPLPHGQESRHVFIARFGSIDLFHFDPYSTALSKVERGRTQDFEDVIALLRAGKIEWERLEASMREILPLMGRKSLRQDPRAFELNFEALDRLRRGESGDAQPPGSGT